MIDRNLARRALAVLDQNAAPPSLVTATSFKDARGVDDDEGEAWSPVIIPPVMPRGAYYGVVGDWVNLIEPHTEASPPTLYIAALVMLGSLIGRSPYVILDGARHGVNLFLLLVGPTSTGRKGTTVGRVRSLLRAIDPDFATRNVIAGLSSGQGLIYHLRDAREASGNEKRADAGVGDKRALVIEAEFSAALRQMSREGNTLSAILREGWDGYTLRTLTKADPLTATDPHLSVVAQVTPEELRRTMGEVESFNGFANRFLFAWSERSRLLPFGSEPNEADSARIVATISRAVTNARAISKVGLSTAGRDWYADRYEDLTTGKPGRMGAATQRAAAQVRRLGTLFAVLDRSHAVDATHLDAALAVWNYAAESAAWVLGGLSLSPKAEKLVSLLLDAGSEGMSRSAIRRDVFGSNNIKSEAITVVLQEVRDAGIARASSDTSGEGRPVERWTHIRHLNPVGRDVGNKGDMGEMGAHVVDDSQTSHISHFPRAS